MVLLILCICVFWKFNIYFQLISYYVKLCIHIQLYIVFDITLLSLTLALFLLSTTILWLMFDSWFIFNICIIVLKLTNVFWGIFIHIILWDLFHSIVSGRGMSSDYITDLCHVISVLYFCMIILIIFSFHCISICLTYYIAILQYFILFLTFHALFMGLHFYVLYQFVFTLILFCFMYLFLIAYCFHSSSFFSLLLSVYLYQIWVQY